MILRRTSLWWLAPMVLVLGVRVYFYLATPLLDNDSIVIFMGAREFAEKWAVSKVNTLPVVLAGILYRIFGDHILLARAAQLLAGIGTLALLYKAGRKFGANTGPMAVVIFGALPIAVLYGGITKSYTLMVFFIFWGALMYDKGVSKPCSVCAGIAGVFFALAFLCYTFAASAVFPVALIFIGSVFSKKIRLYLKPSLITGLVFGALLAAIIAWRWQQFGWSVFNDYVTDWRFDLAKSIWHGRFVGLMDIWGAGIALIIPGIVILFHKPDVVRKLGPIGVYGFWFVLINICLWLLNPVNHFPRVLLPSLPFIALFIGAAIERMMDEKKHIGTIIAWAAATIISIFILYPRFREGNVPLGSFRPDTGSGIALTVLVIAVGFIALLYSAFFLSKRRLSRTWIIPVVVTVLSLGFGPLMAWQSVAAQSRIFQYRAELVRQVAVASIMGGGDYQVLARAGTETVPTMTDLDSEDLEAILNGNILEVCRKRGISHVIVPRKDHEGTLQMLAGLAMTKGKKIRNIANVYRPLYDMSQASRMISNGYGSVYKIHQVKPLLWTEKEKAKLFAYHSPFEVRPPSAMLWFGKKPGQIYYKDDGQMPGRTWWVGIITNNRLNKLVEKVVDPGQGRINLKGWEEHAKKGLVVEIRNPDGKTFRQVAAKLPPSLKTIKAPPGGFKYPPGQQPALPGFGGQQ